MSPVGSAGWLAADSHAQAMISACWTLGRLPQLEGLRLRPWAHMLGFRRYSTTLRCLRQARHGWRMRRIEKAFRLDEPEPEDGEETILVTGQWQYSGRGHSPGEAIYARTIAQDLAENRRIVRQIRWEQEDAA